MKRTFPTYQAAGYALCLAVLLFGVRAAYAQPGPFTYASFYLVDEGRLIRADDRNYEISLMRSDSQNLVRSNFNVIKIAGPQAYNTDAAWGEQWWGEAAFPQFYVEIIRRHKSKMTVLIDVPLTTSQLIKYYRIRFSEGTYRLTDSSLGNTTCMVIGGDTAKLTQARLSQEYNRVLSRAAEQHMAGTAYEKAIRIYEGVYACSRDTLLTAKIATAYAKLEAKNKYRLYLDQIKYGDEKMREARYDEALYFYTEAKKMSGDRDKYINRQLSTIQHMSRKHRTTRAQE